MTMTMIVFFAVLVIDTSLFTRIQSSCCAIVDSVIVHVQYLLLA